ncbi:hypothetical protein O3301_27435 [Janthinobacterium sp. SUN211]|nr:hypothetical protein [Janthinobacterium sp. SUN211]MDO8052211.1 hypothetical protein [Janthinobacterium sp. SUN211]
MHIERALTLFMLVAWRIAFLMPRNRTSPDLDATLFCGVILRSG